MKGAVGSLNTSIQSRFITFLMLTSDKEHRRKFHKKTIFEGSNAGHRWHVYLLKRPKWSGHISILLAQLGIPQDLLEFDRICWIFKVPSQTGLLDYKFNETSYAAKEFKKTFYSLYLKVDGSSSLLFHLVLFSLLYFVL